MYYNRSRGEMDITAVFGTVILGSNPGGSTKVFKPYLVYHSMIITWIITWIITCAINKITVLIFL